jgi:prolyl-tRNA synthetase
VAAAVAVAATQTEEPRRKPKQKQKKKQKQKQQDASASSAPTSVKIAKRSDDYSQWYLDVIAAADLVDDAPVRGCKILRPAGFAIWESIQGLLDPKLKSVGVQNAYFPLLIPVSFLSKEATHVDGFAKECAVVTHHRLKSVIGENGEAGVGVDPDSKLTDPYVIRPTSETVVWHMYGKWIQSYQDLPLKMNQWVNVMRWEMRTRPFLRSAEFLWQEGHTAHATKAEADATAREVLDLYVWLGQEQLGLPLYPGRKSARERFAGADETYTIECLTQNGMAIQAGTSHFLGQNFAKAFDVTYQSEEQKSEFVWATSWGVSTRLIGAIIMVHSDDDGLVLPPPIAAVQVVICVLHAKDAEKLSELKSAAEKLGQDLQAVGLRVRVDARTGVKLGARCFEYERKGVTLRLELGARDLENGFAMAKMRTGGDKFQVPLGDAAEAVPAALERVQKELRERSAALKEKLTFRPKSLEEFNARLKESTPGMLIVPWGGDSEDEEKIQEETGATLRCYPFELESEPIPEGTACPLTGKPAWVWAIFAPAY